MSSYNLRKNAPLGIPRPWRGSLAKRDLEEIEAKKLAEDKPAVPAAEVASTEEIDKSSKKKRKLDEGSQEDDYSDGMPVSSTEEIKKSSKKKRKLDEGSQEDDYSDGPPPPKKKHRPQEKRRSVESAANEDSIEAHAVWPSAITVELFNYLREKSLELRNMRYNSPAYDRVNRHLVSKFPDHKYTNQQIQSHLKAMQKKHSAYMDGKRATGGGARTYSADDKLIFDAMSYRLNVPTQALTNLVTSHRKAEYYEDEDEKGVAVGDHSDALEPSSSSASHESDEGSYSSSTEKTKKKVIKERAVKHRKGTLQSALLEEMAKANSLQERSLDVFTRLAETFTELANKIK